MKADETSYGIESKQVYGQAVGDGAQALTQINNIFQSSFEVRSRFQLPRDIGDFTGRNAELETIEAALLGESDAVVISALSGMPGVGKSALAIHVAHRLKERFPDAHLYVNLRGYDEMPSQPEDVLASFINLLGGDSVSIPVMLDDRAVVYRSLLEGKRALVLLDNARDEAQVRDLMPGSSSCAVLITSRVCLSVLEGSEAVTLGVLSEQDALDLLQAIGGAARVAEEWEEAKAVASLCGHLPLAIRIAGAILKQNPRWTVARLAERLREERKRLNLLEVGDLSVRTSFALSYRQLAEADQVLFRWLALLPKDFGVGVAAVVPLCREEDALSFDQDAIEAGLERLVAAQLLEEISEARYQFHDLMRLFALAQLEKSNPLAERQAGRLRAVHFYRDYAAGQRNADGEQASLGLGDYLLPQVAQQVAQSMPLGEGITTEEMQDFVYSATMSQFELEHENFEWAIQEAYSLEDWQKTVDLFLACGTFWKLRDHWLTHLKLSSIALQAARHSGDRLGEANTLQAMGDVLQFLKQSQEAVERYNEALGLYKAVGARLGEANTLRAMGDLLLRQENLDEEGFKQGWDNLMTAYGLYCDIGDRYSQARILLTSIAPVLLWQESREEAISVIIEAAKIADAINYEPMQQYAADMLKNLQK